MLLLLIVVSIESLAFPMGQHAHVVSEGPLLPPKLNTSGGVSIPCAKHHANKPGPGVLVLVADDTVVVHDLRWSDFHGRQRVGKLRPRRIVLNYSLMDIDELNSIKNILK